MSKSPLTVGARALAKHTHRDRSEGWWGPCSGSETDKNSAAFKVLAKLLAGCIWINLHFVPPDKSVYEVRVAQVRGSCLADSEIPLSLNRHGC